MYYEPTAEDIENLAELRRRMETLFGPELVFGPQVEDADPENWIHRGHIVPSDNGVQKRLLDLGHYIFGKYVLTISTFKAHEDKPVAYVIKFYREVQRRGYRSRVWEPKEGSKCWVSGKTVEMAWANFYSRWTREDFAADGLSAPAHILMERYDLAHPVL